MKCRAEGCENDAVYKKEQLCQKHYFRQKRYGTTELTRPKAVPLRSMDAATCGLVCRTIVE